MSACGKETVCALDAVLVVFLYACDPSKPERSVDELPHVCNECTGCGRAAPKSKWAYLPRGWRRPFGGELATRVRNVRAIRKDYNSVQARIKRWIEAFEAATDESREQSIVFYREPDGERALRAYHTRDVRLEQAGK